MPWGIEYVTLILNNHIQKNEERNLMVWLASIQMQIFADCTKQNLWFQNL